MSARTDHLDLASLRLSPGEGRRLELTVALRPLLLAGETYRPEPSLVPLKLEISRMVGPGYALRITFAAALAGPCMRCLKDGAPLIEIDAREVDRPSERGGDESDELCSPYVSDEVLDVGAWAHDAFALAVPVKVLCREDCRGLCPVCAADLNEAGPDHHHEAPADPRWAKLRELKLD